MSEWEQFNTEQAWREYFWSSQKLIKSLQEKADEYNKYSIQLIELEKNGVWGAINKLQTKLDAIKEIMKTMCTDVDCDLFNEDKAEWCTKCPIFELEKILGDSDAEKEEDS